MRAMLSACTWKRTACTVSPINPSGGSDRTKSVEPCRYVDARSSTLELAGSDVGAIATTAKRDGDDFVLDGVKTWISNGGIASYYVVFARSESAPGPKGLSAFVVEADAPGFRVAEPIVGAEGRTDFVRVVIERDGVGFGCRVTGSQSSGVLTSMVRAHGLAIVDGTAQKGDVVTVQVLDAAFLEGDTPGYP